MSLAQGNNTPTRPRIEPGSPDPESDALTTRLVRSLRSVRRTLNVAAVSMSKLSKWLMSLHCYRKIGNNFPHFSDFSLLKITICIAYKYKQINVPNLVYFGSPGIASYNDYSTISINLHI